MGATILAVCVTMSCGCIRLSVCLSVGGLAVASTIASVVDDYTMVQFVPLDPNDEDTIDNVLIQVDMVG